MRKRLIGFLLILCMMITTIMPVDLEVLEEHNPEYWNVMSQAGTI